MVKNILTVFCIGTLLLSSNMVLADGKRYAVAVSVANIRSKPDATKNNILWQVGRYHPIVVVEESRGWCRFRDYEGDEGWISKKLIKKIPTVITVGTKIHVRSGPGRKYASRFQVDGGIPFRVIKSKKSKHWLRVQHADGDTGWIHKSLVW